LPKIDLTLNFEEINKKQKELVEEFVNPTDPEASTSATSNFNAWVRAALDEILPPEELITLICSYNFIKICKIDKTQLLPQFDSIPSGILNSIGLESVYRGHEESYQDYQSTTLGKTVELANGEGFMFL
jgi:hypothetical protein